MIAARGLILWGCAFALLSSSADAGFKEMFLFGDLFLNSGIAYDNMSLEDVDSASHWMFMDSGTGFQSSWEAERSVVVSNADQSAYAMGSAEVETSATEIRISMMTSIQAELGSSGISSGSNCFNRFSVDLLFESDTEVEVLTRFEFEPSTASYLYGESSFGGLVDAPVDRLVVSASDASGSFEVGYRAIAPAGDYLTLVSEISGEAYTDFGGFDQDSGVFRMTTIVRVVPAPGGIGTLMAMGVIVCRRRRVC